MSFLSYQKMILIGLGPIGLDLSSQIFYILIIVGKINSY